MDLITGGGRVGRLHYFFFSIGLGVAATLVISEFAGAVEELGTEAVVVNAYDPDSVVAGLEEAAALPPADQRRRTACMARTVRHHDVHRWAAAFLDRLGTPTGP